MPLKPIGDRIVVKAADGTNMTKGGLYLAKEEVPSQGTVLAVGPGLTENGVTVPLTVQVGDVVVFSKHAGAELKLEGEKFLVMRQDDVLVVLTPSDSGEQPTCEV